MKRPHLVKTSKDGKYMCDKDCPNYKSLGVCSHVVAVAQHNHSLQDFCDYYTKLKCVPSVTRLLLTGMPSGIGKNGNRVSKK